MQGVSSTIEKSQMWLFYVEGKKKIMSNFVLNIHHEFSVHTNFPPRFFFFLMLNLNFIPTKLMFP